MCEKCTFCTFKFILTKPYVTYVFLFLSWLPLAQCSGVPRWSSAQSVSRWRKKLVGCLVVDMGVSKHRGTPRWMVKIMENPIKMDDLRNTTIFANIHIMQSCAKGNMLTTSLWWILSSSKTLCPRRLQNQNSQKTLGADESNLHNSSSQSSQTSPKDHMSTRWGRLSQRCHEILGARLFGGLTAPAWRMLRQDAALAGGGLDGWLSHAESGGMQECAGENIILPGTNIFPTVWHF